KRRTDFLAPAIDHPVFPLCAADEVNEVTTDAGDLRRLDAVPESCIRALRNPHLAPTLDLLFDQGANRPAIAIVDERTPVTLRKHLLDDHEAKEQPEQRNGEDTPAHGVTYFPAPAAPPIADSAARIIISTGAACPVHRSNEAAPW